MSINRIFILGDSFSNNTCENNEFEKDIGWFEEIKKQNKNSEYYNFAESSKDHQSIIDMWIKIIPFLNKKDVLIIWFPTLNRHKIPMLKKNYKKYQIENNLLIERFIGSRNDFNIQKKDTELWDIGYDKDYFEEKLKTQTLINTSLASEENFIEIIETLYHITPSKTLLFTWNELQTKSSILLDKKILEYKMGIWETKNDLFNKTNGKFGIQKDEHFSYNTHFAFLKYLNHLIFKNSSLN